MDSSSEENQDRFVLMTCTGLTEILVGKIRLPFVQRLAAKVWVFSVELTVCLPNLRLSLTPDRFLAAGLPRNHG